MFHTFHRVSAVLVPQRPLASVGEKRAVWGARGAWGGEGEGRSQAAFLPP